MRDVCGYALKDGPILVTGAAGFAGTRLMELFGLGKGDIAADSTDGFPAPAGVRKIVWNLPGPPPDSLEKVSYVIHLAALSSVSETQESRDLVHRVNAEGTASVCDWILKVSPDARLLFASSSEVYLPSKNRLDESSPIKPRSPYGESKLAAEKLLTESGLQYVISRSFPHFGPGQSGNFVLPSFCRRIITAIAGGRKSIATGNLAAVRDYLFIDDVVSAYACLLSGGKAGGIYNVCSGQGNSIGELLNKLLEISGTGLEAIAEPHLLRENDQLCQIGSPAKLRALDWTREVSLERGLAMLYQWWEEQL